MIDAYIVTFGGGRNYGSRLQATALCKQLMLLGYNPLLLRKYSVFPMFIKHPQMLYARAINKINISKKRHFFNPTNTHYEMTNQRNRRLEEYENEHTKYVNILNINQWNEIVKKNPIFIVGSDIIWQPAMGYPAKNFLDFAYYSKLKMFSYASSFGANELPKKYYSAYKKYLSAYTGVSVREKSAAKMLSEITGLDVKNVVDPTGLLDKSQWDEFAARADFSVELPDKFILCYFVMEDPKYWDYMKIVQKIANLPIVVLPMHQSDEDQPYTVIKDGTPYEFIWLIDKAEFVCTDSFHACVFSMYYEKEFYLMRRNRKDEDAKYDDFLNRYGLSDRQVTDESKFVRKTDVDYALARKQIVGDREYSINYLKNCLGKE